MKRKDFSFRKDSKPSPVKFDFYVRRIGELQAQFPDIFNKAFPPILAVGIHRQLVERTNFTKKEISAILSVWVSRIEYVAMGQSQSVRTDLDGNLTLITDEHRQGFVSNHPEMGEKFIARFARRYLKTFGVPAFINVPIKMRKEI